MTPTEFPLLFNLGLMPSTIKQRIPLRIATDKEKEDRDGAAVAPHTVQINILSGAKLDGKRSCYGQEAVAE